MKRYQILYFFLFLIFFNCSSKKDIIYLQSSNLESIDFSYLTYKIKIDDILKIDVVTENPEVTLSFNRQGLNSNFLNNKEAMVLNSYQVDAEGNINFPTLGSIFVLNKTLIEVRNLIYEYIKDNDYLINPMIDVKLINASFTILGEVLRPGRYEFLKNNLNILEAIGYAGDLTINGKRNDIRVVREIDGKSNVFSLDLTMDNLLSDKNYQILSGDIIIVNPNNTRIKNAGIIGNSGTLISLLSFLLSSIIVINN